jgi:hypothetical protein
MAWPQFVEGKKGVEWWSPLPIKTEEPKNAARSLSNLIQLSGVDNGSVWLQRMN